MKNNDKFVLTRWKNRISFDFSSIECLFATNKRHLSAYLCTPSGWEKEAHASFSIPFVRSKAFSLPPLGRSSLYNQRFATANPPQHLCRAQVYHLPQGKYHCAERRNKTARRAIKLGFICALSASFIFASRKFYESLTGFVLFLLRKSFGEKSKNDFL